MTDSNAIARGAARLLRSRRAMRAPIWIYRAGLGFIFGSRLLMLEHIGRKSGVLRQVVLEVVGHPVPDTYIVVSGFGHKAQWFRNLQADPRIRVSVGFRRSATGTARELNQEEADDALAVYVREHPRAWKQMKPALEETLGAAISESHTALPMMELRLTPRNGTA